MMLVLSRKLGQEIVIGDGIRVSVVEVRPNKVRLGIVAPHEVAVHRKEVHDQIKEQKQCAHGSERPSTNREEDCGHSVMTSVAAAATH